MTVTATAWAHNDADCEVTLPSSASEFLVLPSGWQIVSSQPAKNVQSNGRNAGKQFVCQVKVPESYKTYTGPYNAPYNEPYTNDAYPNGGVKGGCNPEYAQGSWYRRPSGSGTDDRCNGRESERV